MTYYRLQTYYLMASWLATSRLSLVTRWFGGEMTSYLSTAHAFIMHAAKP